VAIQPADEPVGPHPKAQFEAHFREDALPQVVSLIKESGLTALVHLPLDLSVLDPPGMNKGVARFGKSDF